MKLCNAGLSSVLYHYAGFNNALYNLEHNTFTLSKLENISREIDPNYRGFYFLSTTRSKVGGYHLGKRQGVIFVLDGKLISQKYKGMPIDFWKSIKTEDKLPTDPRLHDEMEDRILAKTPEIPLSRYVTEIHMYANNDVIELVTFPHIRSAAQKLNIPLYEYDDMRDWKQLNKKEGHLVNKKLVAALNKVLADFKTTRKK